MNNFNESLNCPICKNKLKQNDDIVVCPKCGAPYHRECYDSLGHCMYEEKHSPDFSYSNPYNSQKNKENGSDTYKKCPHCLNENPSEALFCNKCGFPFTKTNSDQVNNPTPEINPFTFDPLYGFDKNEKINDIKISELGEFIKNNLTYYITVFKNINDRKKSRFNFSAFLFSGAWFLYRKLYKIGVILTSIVMLLMIASTFIEFTYAMDILSPLLNSAGITSSASFTLEQYNNLITQFSLLPIEQKIILSLPSIIKFINFIIMLVSGSIANRLYLKSCTSRIKKIKTLCNKDQRLYKEEIKKHGGVNLKIVPLLLICYIIIEYLPRFII